eukprot:Rhum_TRINITY_DN14756_c20_g1::Rhum_TRINITY_DN14756_c20_g1_i1::g.114920::m.114920
MTTPLTTRLVPASRQYHGFALFGAGSQPVPVRSPSPGVKPSLQLLAMRWFTPTFTTNRLTVVAFFFVQRLHDLRVAQFMLPHAVHSQSSGCAMCPACRLCSPFGGSRRFPLCVELRASLLLSLTLGEIVRLPGAGSLPLLASFCMRFENSVLFARVNSSSDSAPLCRSRSIDSTSSSSELTSCERCAKLEPCEEMEPASDSAQSTLRFENEPLECVGVALLPSPSAMVHVIGVIRMASTSAFAFMQSSSWPSSVTLLPDAAPARGTWILVRFGHFSRRLLSVPALLPTSTPKSEGKTLRYIFTGGGVTFCGGATIGDPPERTGGDGWGGGGGGGWMLGGTPCICGGGCCCCCCC